MEVIIPIDCWAGRCCCIVPH